VKVLKLVNNGSQAYNLSQTMPLHLGLLSFDLFNVADDELPLEKLILTCLPLGFRNESLMLPQCALSKMLIAGFHGISYVQKLLNTFKQP